MPSPKMLLPIQAVFGFIFGNALWLMGYKRHIIQKNLEITGITPGIGFRSLLCQAAARDLFALFFGASLTPKLRSRSAAHFQAMQQGPCLLLTAHFHNWERFGSELTRLGLPLLAGARAMKNPWAQKLLLWARKRLQLATISESVSRNALKQLEHGQCFALLWDQHSPNSEFTHAFFNRPVLMNPIPFFLLRQKPCPVYFGLLLPNGNLRLLPLLSQMKPGWEKKMMGRYHRVLQVVIQQYPEYWYGFFHARFKNTTRYPGRR